MRRTGPLLLIFIVVALTCGWVGVVIDRLADSPSDEQGPGMLFWLVAPLATVVVLRWLHGGWKDAGLRTHLPAELEWYHTAIAIPLIIGGVAIGLAKLVGGATFSDDWSRYFSLAFAALAFNFIKNIFEEFAWRGYLTSKMLELGFGDWPLYLGSGLVWGLWHLPYYLYLLDPELVTNTLDVSRLTFALMAIAVLMCWTVVQVELFRLTGTVWVPLVLHTIHNSFIDPLAAEKFVTMPRNVGIFFSPILGIGTMALWLAIGFWLRHIRLGRERRAAAVNA